MTEETGKPVRNTFRFGAKIIEWIAALSITAIIIENLGFVENISSVVAGPARKLSDALPNLVEYVAQIPFPSSMTQAVSDTKMAQDFNLLLNLVALWVVGRLLVGLFRLIGAKRSKAENAFSILVKLLIVLALLSEAVRFAMGSGTIDLFEGLIPLFMKNGGDIPGWLSNNNLREIIWVVSSAITGLLLAIWTYRSHIKQGGSKAYEASVYEPFDKTNEPEKSDNLEGSEIQEIPEGKKRRRRRRR